MQPRPDEYGALSNRPPSPILDYNLFPAEPSDDYFQEGRLRLKLLGIFDHKGIQRHQNQLPLQSPSRVPGPYGVHQIMDQGIDLSVVAPAKSRIHRKLRDLIEHRLGMRVDLAVRGWILAFRVDGILAMLEDKSVLPSLLKQWGIPPFSQKTLSVVSCWWAEELLSGDEPTRRKIRRILRGIDRLYCFSKNQVAIFEEAGLPRSRIVPVTFGVDPNFYSPGPGTKKFQVVSAGVDRGRDYDSLVRASALLPDIQFDIFTQRGRIEKAALPPNVRLHAPVTMQQHRDNLRSATLVVIPTHDLAYPTGQSILLEAMACGKCVAVTATKAMSEYIDDGIINLALPIADPAGMAGIIREALNSDGDRERIGRAARSAIMERFSFERMWKDIATSLSADVRRPRNRENP